ncbi:MAG: replication associated protein [Wigfec virus K19_448]|nr:MAG: replication associated protein [Wigfec virus K19_448]
MAKKLRFASKHIFLTYAQCGIPLATVLDLLNLKLHNDHNAIKNYIISHEDHQDGTPHRHCWIEVARAPDRVPEDYFDIDGHHGNYQSIKYEDNCAKYVLKNGDYISSFTPEQLQQKIERANNRSYEKLDKAVVGRELMQGTPLLDIVSKFPALMFDLGKLKENLMLFKQLNQCQKNLETLENEWIFGDTGSGKSKYARSTYPDAFIKDKSEFWDSYEFQDIVLLEDVDETWEDVLYQLKIWADHYIFAGRIKHKPSLNLRPKKIIITSNYTIREVMERIFKRKGIKHDDMLIQALERRFKVTRLDKPVDPNPLGVYPKGYFLEENKENIFECYICGKDCTCFLYPGL